MQGSPHVLEKRFQRLGADVEPVADEEIYEVVRSRLFESIDGVQAGGPPPDLWYLKKVAQVYRSMYAAHSGEVLSKAVQVALTRFWGPQYQSLPLPM